MRKRERPEPPGYKHEITTPQATFTRNTVFEVNAGNDSGKWFRFDGVAPTGSAAPVWWAWRMEDDELVVVHNGFIGTVIQADAESCDGLGVTDSP